MSCYITIRKKGVYLCSFNRDTEFYKAFEGQASVQWSELRIEDLNAGLSYLEEDMNKYKKAIERYEKSLRYLKKADDVHEAISSIQGFEEEIEEEKEAYYYIKFLVDIWYQDEGKMEWKIG